MATRWRQTLGFISDSTFELNSDVNDKSGLLKVFKTVQITKHSISDISKLECFYITLTFMHLDATCNISNLSQSQNKIKFIRKLD